MVNNKCIVCNQYDSFNKAVFLFPSDPARKAAWINRMNNDQENMKPHSRICAAHFTDSQFCNQKKLRLKKDATPTIINTETWPINAGIPCKQKKLAPKLPLTSFRINTDNTKSSTLASSYCDVGSLSQLETLTFDKSNRNFRMQVTLTSTVEHSPNAVVPWTLPDADTPTLENRIQNQATPSPVRKIKTLKRLVKNRTEANRKLRLRLINTGKKNTPEEKLQDLFGHDPNLMSLIKMQYDRSKAYKSKAYEDHEKAIAFTIYYHSGRRSYESLCNLGFHLPSIRSLNHWLQSLDFNPGFSKSLMNTISEFVLTLNSYEKDCMLLWDEMRIKQCIEYDKNNDKLIGLVDHGGEERELIPAKEALVFMVRSISGHWSYPVGYIFSGGPTETTTICRLISECLTNLQQMGLKIRVCISDMGWTNQGVFRKYGITEHKPYIHHNNQKIYFIYDTCHLIKLVRNHLKDKTGFFYGDGKLALWETIERCRLIDSGTSIRILTKLTDAHFELTDKTKMKVKLATQVLSKSVGSAIRLFVEIGKLDPHCLETAQFVETLNDMFDLMNISTRQHAVPLKRGNDIFKNKYKLQEYKSFVETWFCADGKPLPGCINGLIQSLEGFYMLLGDLEAEGYHYVLTRRIQQDALEHYFAAQRGASGFCSNPTARQFTQNWKKLFLCKIIHNSLGSNCEVNGSSNTTAISFSKLKHIIECSNQTASHPSSSYEVPLPLNELSMEEFFANENNLFGSFDDFFNIDEEEPKSLKDFNGAVYIFSWAAKKVRLGCDCEVCELVWEDPTDVLMFRENEQLLSLKSFSGDTPFKNPKPFSYGARLNEETCSFAEHLVEMARISLRETLSDNGTKVCERTTKRLVEDLIVNTWIGSCEKIPCKLCKMQLIKKLITAKIFLLVKFRNEEFNVQKATTTTLGQLRHV